MQTNMVLRFRDLVAETIPEHRKCIEKNGYVWWGWWSKAEEIVPREEFHKFNKIITDKGFMWIYLADSGTHRLYKAKLVEIDLVDEEEPKECSEMDNVPEYYFASKYKVWFRFENIVDAFPNEIRQWSYDKDCHLTITPSKDEYHLKRISSIDEMLNHCHQTIYFIQTFDADNHIEKLSKIEDVEESPILLDKYAQQILDLIEKINKHCEYVAKKGASPVCMPPYPREMENALKRPAADETYFRDFSSYIYMLIVDGHKMAMNDHSVISKSDFLGFANSLMEAIRIFRCDFHHLNAHQKRLNKKRLGELYCQLAGKSILGTPELRIKFQVELLKWTSKVLEAEYQFLKDQS